jgi:hypothetical protein
MQCAVVAACCDNWFLWWLCWLRWLHKILGTVVLSSVSMHPVYYKNPNLFLSIFETARIGTCRHNTLRGFFAAASGGCL